MKKKKKATAAAAVTTKMRNTQMVSKQKSQAEPKKCDHDFDSTRCLFTVAKCLKNACSALSSDKKKQVNLSQSRISKIETMCHTQKQRDAFIETSLKKSRRIMDAMGMYARDAGIGLQKMFAVSNMHAAEAQYAEDIMAIKQGRTKRITVKTKHTDTKPNSSSKIKKMQQQQQPTKHTRGKATYGDIMSRKKMQKKNALQKKRRESGKEQKQCAQTETQEEQPTATPPLQE